MDRVTDRAGGDRAPLQRAAGLGPRRLLGRLRRHAGRRARRRRSRCGGRRRWRRRWRWGAATAAVELVDGADVVAEARPAELAVAGPAPVGLDEAAAAAERFAWKHDHPFPTCFGCGPERDPVDALCLFCGPVGDGRFAVPWTPPAWTGDGVVEPLFAWAALDCPSSSPVHGTISSPVVLGRFTVALERADRGRRAARDPVVAGAIRRAQAPHGGRDLQRGRRAARRRPRGLGRARAAAGDVSMEVRRVAGTDPVALALVAAMVDEMGDALRARPGALADRARGALAARRRLRRAVGGRQRRRRRRRQAARRARLRDQAHVRRAGRARPRCSAAPCSRPWRTWRASSAMRSRGSTRAPSSRARAGCTSARGTSPCPTTTATRTRPSGGRSGL